MRSAVWFALFLVGGGLAGCLDARTNSQAPALGAVALDCADPCHVDVATEPFAEIETSIAINPLDPDHIVVAFNELRNSDAPVIVPPLPGTDTIGLRVTRDGGDSWEAGALPTMLTYYDDPFWGQVCGAFDPVVLFDREGTPWVGGIARGCAELAFSYTAATWVFMAPSPDGGTTWGRPLVAAGGLPGTIDFLDKPYVDLGPDGTWLFTWVNWHGCTIEGCPAADLEVRVADADGAWRGPATRLVAACLGADLPGCAEAVAGNNPGPSPLATSGGELMVAYRGCAAGLIDAVMEGCERSYNIASSTDGGTTWTIGTAAPLVVEPRPSSRSVGLPYPLLVEDVASGRILLAATDAVDGLYALRVFERGAEGWPAAPGPTAATTDRFMPWIDAQEGVMYAAFFERSREPDELHIRRVLAWWDGAAGGGGNISLEPPWDATGGTPNLIGAPGPTFLAHYEGLDIEAGRIAVAWSVRVPTAEGGDVGIPLPNIDVRVAVVDVRP